MRRVVEAIEESAQASLHRHPHRYLLEEVGYWARWALRQGVTVDSVYDVLDSFEAQELTRFKHYPND